MAEEIASAKRNRQEGEDERQWHKRLRQLGSTLSYGDAAAAAAAAAAPSAGAVTRRLPSAADEATATARILAGAVRISVLHKPFLTTARASP